MIEYDVINTPIVEIVNQIILFASKNRASDIHFDPRENDLLIRMRIDGELKNHTSIPKIYERNLITRVKLISGMNITETRLPQDGAIKGRIEDRDLDMRVAVLPTNEGEKVVIRILDYSKSLDGIETLGFSDKNYILLKKMLSVPNGIILVTGATGSGKSTTTYSMLQALNKENVNIITVEDPVEMNIEGVNQVQVNSEIGMTFAAALRSILREDPNIILIGEIRDTETAQIAVRASITGHLVLSTIHTNNSLNTIERLIDMDVERYLLSSALTGIISQKLARKLCPKCKYLRKTTDYEKEIFRLVANKEVDQVYEAKGCPECTDGYRGRIAIEEVLYINDTLRSAIANPHTSKLELSDMVYTDEVVTLLGDGLDKILSGITTFTEIFKLIEVDLELKSIKEALERRRSGFKYKDNNTVSVEIEKNDVPINATDSEVEKVLEKEQEAIDSIESTKTDKKDETTEAIENAEDKENVTQNVTKTENTEYTTNKQVTSEGGNQGKALTPGEAIAEAEKEPGNDLTKINTNEINNQINTPNINQNVEEQNIDNPTINGVGLGVGGMVASTASGLSTEEKMEIIDKGKVYFDEPIKPRDKKRRPRRRKVPIESVKYIKPTFSLVEIIDNGEIYLELMKNK